MRHRTNRLPGLCTSMLLIIMGAFGVCGQNLIVNGSFADSTKGWDPLIVAGTAAATPAVVNGVYVLSIGAASNDSWHIQLKQQNLQLIQGEAYRFSFDAWAAAPRLIYASVGLEGGAYRVYSDSTVSWLTLTPQPQTCSTLFTMTEPSVSNARVQFNFGLSDIDVSLDNVKLEHITEPTLILQSPKGGELWYSGVSQDIRWVGVNTGAISLAYSSDAGVHWTTISDSTVNTGLYHWNVPVIVSPWCLLRVSQFNGTLSAQSGRHFEIASFANIIRNSSFNVATTGWNPLGVFGKARATGRVIDSAYAITIDSAGSEPWHIQLTQTGIALEQSYAYTLSFEAWADSVRPLQVNIGQYNAPYHAYLDSSAGFFTLSPARQTYTLDFAMKQPTDPDARLEFNVGMSAIDLHFDNIYLFSQRPLSSLPGAHAAPSPGMQTITVRIGPFSKIYTIHFPGPVQVSLIDLQGRCIQTLRRVGVDNTIWDCPHPEVIDRMAMAVTLVQIRGEQGLSALPIIMPGH
jgi:hypothetical protein